MKTLTVAEVAKLSGVSIRTLHHYDQIGLLRPAFTGHNRYRHYGQEQLLRLQQILLHRELGIPLSDIVDEVTDIVGESEKVPKFVQEVGSAVETFVSALTGLYTLASDIAAQPSRIAGAAKTRRSS